MPDPLFADPRLAALYDVFDGPRTDLDAYVAIVDELGVRSMLDLGCGTGSFACRLAARGVAVVGVDPAAASLELARRKPGADQVHWIHGDITAVQSDIDVDLATMTGNVAQAFTTDDDWATTLDGLAARVRPGGWLVLETRAPSARAWEHWTREQTLRTILVPDVGEVTTWTDLIDATQPYVSFRHTFHFAADNTEITSESTLRFRDTAELTATLSDAGFELREVRDAPDRPGLELVVLARRTHA